MARINRNFTINVTYEQFTTGYLKWLPTRPQTAEPEPYIAKTSTGNPAPTSIDIYGELLDLNDLKAYIEERNVEFVINGAAVNPEPGPDPPEPVPDWDLAIAKQALINVILSKKTALDAEFQAEYIALSGTNTPPNPEWKHYRWALQ